MEDTNIHSQEAIWKTCDKGLRLAMLEISHLISMEVIDMKDVYACLEDDINKAYDMGLRSAIYVLEETVGFSVESQLELIEKLKILTSSKEDSD
ncbi:hypothetical protein ACFLZT_02180 [Thermodesulfobacteriota bacterium]